MPSTGDVLRRCAAAATLLLIFLGPVFVDRPAWLYAALIAASITWFVSLRFAFTEHAAARTTGLAMMAVLVCAFAPPFFSDDSLRHVHDGFYLLQGVDVYAIPPSHLPPVPGLDRLPNHPDVGTIYFPFTQMQALAGAALSQRYGFFGIYALICSGLMFLSFRFASAGERRALALLYVSPAFLIFAASRHADVQGLLLAINSYLLWRQARCSRRRSVPFAAAAGACAVLLVGLKPEGVVYLVFLGGLVLLALLQDRRGLHGVAAWTAAALFVTFVQLIFALVWMFPSAEALEAFLSTARFFTDWFIGYNPMVDLLLWFADPGLERPWYLAVYRLMVLVAGLVLCVILLLRRIHRAPVWFAGRGLPIALRGWAREALLVAVAAVVLSKGVWHPWYFLWFVPALGLRRNFRAGAWLCAGLVLAYGPVFYLRRDGVWGGWEVFYVLTAVWIILALSEHRLWIFGRVLVDKLGSTRPS